MKTLRYFGQTLLAILTTAPLHLTALLLGAAMIAWGIFGILFRPGDLERFAQDFMVQLPWVWAVHSVACGLMFIRQAVCNFPPTSSLLFGMYGMVIYTWIAMARPVASMTSGFTLNAVVIIVSALLVHRSGRK